MRFFASSHRLDQLAPRTRWLLLALIGGLVLQLGTGVILHHIGPGWTPDAIATYYRGSDPDAHAAASASDPLAAFAIGEPVDASSAEAELHLPRSFGTLLEIAHFHLLAMPLAVFLSAHLFAMCPLGRRRWSGLIAAITFTCAFADALLPFAVRFHAGFWASGKLIAFLGLVIGHGGMALITAWYAAISLRPGASDQSHLPDPKP